MNPHLSPELFQNKVALANPDLICTAKADAVRVVSVECLLQLQLRIPMFQRRYCWSRDQWRTLLGDATKVAKGNKPSHALGRITCAVRPNGPSDVLVIDGQQRHTTCVLLLAALRDVAAARNPAAPVVVEVNRALFPDAAALAAWATAKKAASSDRSGAITLDEGEELSFAAVVPTYCDRASFYAATLPPALAAVPAGLSGEGVVASAWRRPAEAKAYFVCELQPRGDAELNALATAVLQKLEWLFFPITLGPTSSQGQIAADGTADLGVVFERLAQRDATWCRPHRATEYADMGAADFVRNLVSASDDSCDQY
jgi:hypothetical protein